MLITVCLTEIKLVPVLSCSCIHAVYCYLLLPKANLHQVKLTVQLLRGVNMSGEVRLQAGDSVRQGMLGMLCLC